MGDIIKADVPRHCAGNVATRPNNPNSQMEHIGTRYLALGWLLNVIGWLDKGDISFILSSLCTILAIIHYSLSIKEKTKVK